MVHSRSPHRGAFQGLKLGGAAAAAVGDAGPARLAGTFMLSRQAVLIFQHVHHFTQCGGLFRRVGFAQRLPLIVAGRSGRCAPSAPSSAASLPGCFWRGRRAHGRRQQRCVGLARRDADGLLWMIDLLLGGYAVGRGMSRQGAAVVALAGWSGKEIAWHKII